MTVWAQFANLVNAKGKLKAVFEASLSVLVEILPSRNGMPWVVENDMAGALSSAPACIIGPGWPEAAVPL